VQPVRGGEDDPVGSVNCEQLGQGRVERRAEPVGQLLRGGGGIDDRREPRRTARVDLLDVAPADEAAAGDGDPHPTGHGQLS
jgi:hypothetical protein